MKNNWPNLNPRHFSDVTMPQRCTEAAAPSTLLARYTGLADASAKSVGDEGFVGSPVAKITPYLMKEITLTAFPTKAF